MTVQDLLQSIRDRLRDTMGAVEFRLWSDRELIDDYANTARDRLFLVCRNLLIDSTTASDGDTPSLPVCRITLVPDTATYALSPKIIEISRVKLSLQTLPLSRVTQQRLDDLCIDWQNADSNTPWGWCSDIDTDSITFVPPPLVADTAILTVSRFPLTRLAYNIVPSPSLGFREEYHADLIDGILSLAFAKKDAETDRPDLAAYHEQKFLGRAKEIQLEIHRRLWGAPSTNTPRRAFLSR